MPYKIIEQQKEYNRNYFQENKERIYKQRLLYFEHHPEAKKRDCEARIRWGRQNLLCIKRDGVRVWVRVKKRAFPLNGCCELCGKKPNRKLDYHHWNDEHLERGIWVCYRCHILVEAVDTGKDLIQGYSVLRQSIEKNCRDYSSEEELG